MQIPVEVECCDKCPHAYVTKVWTPDSWEDVRKITCKASGKVVYGNLDWHDKSPIPNDCPFNTSND